jgi:hypothetical protein
LLFILIGEGFGCARSDFPTQQSRNRADQATGQARIKAKIPKLKPGLLAKDPDRPHRNSLRVVDKPTANTLLLPKRESVKRIIRGNSI